MATYLYYTILSRIFIVTKNDDNAVSSRVVLEVTEY